MNRTEVERVRDHLVNLPESRFNYCDYYSWLDPEGVDGFQPISPEDFDIDRVESCGTAGCVAGWVAFLNAEEFKFWRQDHIGKEGEFPHDINNPAYAIHHFAEEKLGLDRTESYWLFLTNVGVADKTSAIQRLDHLLDKGSLASYDWNKELVEFNKRYQEQEVES